MAIEIKLPSLGDGIDSADVLEILVSEGDTVEKEDGLMELETDKATVTVPSPVAGKVVKILVNTGDSVAVGSVFAEIESADSSSSGSSDKKPSEPKKEEPPKAPAEAKESKEEKSESKPTSAQSTKDEESDIAAKKNTTEKSEPESDAEDRKSESVAKSASTSSSPALTTPQAAAEEFDDGSVIPAGPAIRRFAREVGVDLAQVRGTGEGGRITREDVLAVVRQGQQVARGSVPSAASGLTSSAPAASTGSAASGKKLPGTAANDDFGPIRVEKMSKIRRTIAAQMHKSWTSVPRVTNFDDADVTDLELFRQSSKDDYASRGIKLTTMPFLIKAVATALRHHPSMNASIDTENDQIIYKDYVSIGIAVDTERGLVVPNLKNADRMSIPDIAQALSDLATRVRDNDFGVSDLRGGTFTISNLGAIGGTYSTPIVNVPEVAILLVGRTRRMPIVMSDDSIKPRSMMPLSLAYDHRLVDGGTAARFLNDVIGYLEAPSRLLLAI